MDVFLLLAGLAGAVGGIGALTATLHTDILESVEPLCADRAACGARFGARQAGEVASPA